MDTPRVWLGCLASYNAGRLIGEWVDAIDADELAETQTRVAAEAVKAAKAAGEYPVYFGEPEEFYVGDYDGFGDVGRLLGEYPSLKTVAHVGALIEEHGEAFLKWVGTLDSGAELGELTGEDFLEHYRGEWDSEQAYAMEQVCCELGWAGVPTVVYTSLYDEKSKINPLDELASVLDWESIAREMFRHGNYTFVDGHVFEDEV